MKYEEWCNSHNFIDTDDNFSLYLYWNQKQKSDIKQLKIGENNE